MALNKIAAASLLLVVRASEASSNTCANGECLDEESSLLALRAVKGFNFTKFFAGAGMSSCENKEGLFFPCGDGECCGNVCRAKGDLCCPNANGDKFPCGAGGECCGNGCAGAGSKCCTNPDTGYKYPVSDGTACAGTSITCTNSHGNKFQCGEGSSCCGDICVGPGGTCCKSSYEPGAKGHHFVCAKDNKCCGNSCQAPGSKCCITKGLNYPVTQATKCAGWNSGSTTCINRYGSEFLCGSRSSCCGDICQGEGGVCCTNQAGSNFVCGAGSRCGKNVCLAA